MILLVEDDVAIAEAAQESLEDEGYAVTRAANGLEALRLLKDGLRPCLVLLDLMMPIMGGLEVLTSMQAESALASIPVVVTTAMHKPVAQGARGIIRKPYELSDLLAAAERFCAPGTA